MLRAVTSEIERLESLDAYPVSATDEALIEEWLLRGYTGDEIRREVRATIDERTLAVARRLTPSVRPLFWEDDEGRSHLLASGVLFGVGPHKFLLTAAHVIDDWGRFFPAPAEGRFWYTAIEAGCVDPDQFSYGEVRRGNAIVGIVPAFTFAMPLSLVISERSGPLLQRVPLQ